MNKAAYAPGIPHLKTETLVLQAVRMRFYRSTFALQEALFGIEQGDEQAYRAGMRDFV